MAGTQFDAIDGFSVNGTPVVNASGVVVGSISSPNVVNSFNGATGTVVYSPRLATASLTGVASFGNEFIVSAAGAVSLTGNYVKTVNGVTGAVTIAQGSNVTVSTVGSTITIASSGGGGSPPLATSSITGVASFGNEFVVSALGAVSLTSNYVKSVNGQTGNVTLSGLPAVIPLATSSITGVASFGNEFVVSAAGAVSLTGNYVKSFNGATGTVTYSPEVATTSVTGVASFNSNQFSVSAGAVSLRGVTGSAGIIRTSQGTSTSNTAGTVLATLTAGAGNCFMAWTLHAAQSSTANTTMTVTITYSDSTTTTLTTTASTACTILGSAAGLVRTTGGGLPTTGTLIQALDAKYITKIEVTTAGTGTGSRGAAISVLEVSQ